MDEQGEILGCTLDDIQNTVPRHFSVIKHHIAVAEEEYRADNFHSVDLKITAAKKAFFSAVKEYKQQKR